MKSHEQNQRDVEWLGGKGHPGPLPLEKFNQAQQVTTKSGMLNVDFKRSDSNRHNALAQTAARTP